MATLKFFTKGDKEESTVHVRFANGRKFDFKRATPYRIKTNHWNTEKQQLRNIASIENKDEINSSLEQLRSHINKTYLLDYGKGVFITSEWLKTTIDKFYGQQSSFEMDLFTDYGIYFIRALPNKKNQYKDGELGVAKSTIQKYENVVKKIKAFEKHMGSKLYIRDVNLKFEKDFIIFLKEVEKLSENTIGRTITFVKTICNDAKIYGITTSPQLEKVKGFKKKAKFIYLSEGELKKINEFDFKLFPYLDNACDWLIIGSYTGQRVSDFMAFTKKTIKNGFLEFTQKKTGAKTLVPIHPMVKQILEKNNGGFPRKISEQRLNEYIKKVCEKVGLTELVEGGKMNPETNRKEYGEFSKFELVTSHICRRSFATNHYTKLPTPVLMSITNHSTEKSFLTYIGKTSQDHAKILQKYWAEQKGIQDNQTHLKLVKTDAI